MTWYQRILIAGIDTLRPFLGFINLVCIYPLSCTDYAKKQLSTKPLYIAIPTIIIRVLSCNPLTAIIRRYYKKS